MTKTEIQQLFIAFQNARRKRLKKRLNIELEEAIINELKRTDDEFVRLLIDNNELLVSKSVKFRVYQEDSGPWGTHAKVLEGKTHNNGHMYLQTRKQMSPFMPFASNLYPTRFSGNIKWNGNIKLDSTETDFRIFGSRVPQLFEGRIDVNGQVEMKVVDSDFDPFGHYLMSKLICDPFNKDERKRKRYVSNLARIERVYNSYLNELKNTAHNIE